MTLSISADGVQASGLKLMSRPSTGDEPWWMGKTRLDVLSSGDRISLLVHDGISQGSTVSLPLQVKDGQVIALSFADSQCRSLNVFDENGGLLRSVDFPSLQGVSLPNGLFPERRVCIGATTAPHATVTLRPISLSTAPAGSNQATLGELGDGLGITTGSLVTFGVNTQSTLHDLRGAANERFSVGTFWLSRGQYD